MIKRAYFGGGCFWCLEAAFRLVPGVEDVMSGYAGGQEENPTYEQVSAGKTNHAEVVEIRYDPERVMYDDLLNVFFLIHDPTTKNRQGADVGPQYRSIVLYNDEDEKTLAEQHIKALEDMGIWKNIVTQVVPIDHFWFAEDYHQRYFEKNPQQAYCRAVVRPKIEKLVGKLGMY
jgi:peptide-methionine (S)-S-oxide reductase